MDGINSELLRAALAAVSAPTQKQAFVPAGASAGADPAAAAAGGAMPPGAPPGGMPMDPAAMAAGGAPPGGMPMDPAMMGQPPTPGQPPMPGQMPGSVSSSGEVKKPKLDPALLDQRLYSVQMQLTALLNHFEIKMPPEMMVMPPAGMPTPTPEQAMPGAGSPADLVQPGGGQQQGGSAIPPIEPMQAAMPAAPAEKAAVDEKEASRIGEVFAANETTTKAAAAAARLRSHGRRISANPAA